MSIFPKVTGKRLIKALCKNGFSKKRQKVHMLILKIIKILK
jgi:predicted RNA binding protein YcfA (HicA-like mRNA interferase family)